MSFDQNALDSLRIDRSPEPKKRPRSRRVYAALVAATLVVLAAVGYGVLRDHAIEVETATAVAAAATHSGAAVLDASGYVVARRQATVSSKVTGKVVAVLIEEGMAVKEGQLLAKLDDTTARPVHALALRELDAARRNVAEVQVRLEEAQRNERRMRELRRNMLVSELEADRAQSEVAALQARLEALQASIQVAAGTVRVRAQEIEDLLVRAPFDGVVVSKDAQPGEMVSPISAGGGFTRTGIATLVDMASREIEVDVNEAFINRVQPGQKTQAVLDAYPDWVIASHVINIVPTADRQKATVRVRIGFDELEPRILPDMGVKVSFLERNDTQVSSARPAVRVPAAAVVREGGTSFVWRVEDDQLERVVVSTGGERDGQIEILSGINSGDVVVAQPVPGLGEGTRVKSKSSQS
jgi:RND family efflux transporter MFP subunit